MSISQGLKSLGFDKFEITFIVTLVYYDDQKNSVPAPAGAVATSHTVFLLNRVLCVCTVQTAPSFYLSLPSCSSIWTDLDIAWVAPRWFPVVIWAEYFVPSLPPPADRQCEDPHSKEVYVLLIPQNLA